MKRSSISILILFIFGTFGIQAQSDPTLSPCMTCEELMQLSLPDVTIQSTELITEDANYCKLLGTISKEIGFEVLLPNEWNQRFLMSGGGGFVGQIQNDQRWRTQFGYVTAGTDTGHQAHGLKADWALNNMERQLNFGRLAIHRTATVAKAIIDAYYCESSAYNYFAGCSRGGGQAMIEAQLYPDDFDGILTMAPILDWPSTGAEFVRNVQAIYPNPQDIMNPVVSPEHIQLLYEEVNRQCDEIDGVKDGIINDPRDCQFDFAQLPKCTEVGDAKTCFTDQQIVVVETIYEGTYADGKVIYPGFPYGCEGEPGGLVTWISGPVKPLMNLGLPSLHYAFGTEMFKYFVFNDPDWDYSTYNFENFEADTEYADAFLNATSTDYSRFKDRGGKMIVWHGWNDYALSAYTMIDHYEEAMKVDSELTDYMRLYLLPGVLHCAGGTGPSDADWLLHLRQWVEEGVAPEKIIVSEKEENQVVMSRPVFPYPSRTVYKGEGDPNQADSFVEEK